MNRTSFSRVPSCVFRHHGIHSCFSAAPQLLCILGLGLLKSVAPGRPLAAHMYTEAGDRNRQGVRKAAFTSFSRCCVAHETTSALPVSLNLSALTLDGSRMGVVTAMFDC